MLVDNINKKDYCVEFRSMHLSGQCSQPGPVQDLVTKQ